MRALTVIVLASVLMFVAGCEGEEGPVGPSGNANVVTGTISPTNEEWLWHSGYQFQANANTWITYFTRYVDIPLDEITPEFLEAGVVLVSFEAAPGSGNWTPLPFHFPGIDRTYIETMVFDAMEGNLRLHFFNIPNQSGTTLPDLEAWLIPTYTFRYTLIEGNALPVMMAEGIDVSDHGQVLEYISSQ